MPHNMGITWKMVKFYFTADYQVYRNLPLITLFYVTLKITGNFASLPLTHWSSFFRKEDSIGLIKIGWVLKGSDACLEKWSTIGTVTWMSQANWCESRPHKIETENPGRNGVWHRPTVVSTISADKSMNFYGEVLAANGPYCSCLLKFAVIFFHSLETVWRQVDPFSVTNLMPRVEFFVYWSCRYVQMHFLYISPGIMVCRNSDDCD